MLLPQYDAETGEPVQEDPRKELVSRLLEYQQFQEMSKWFKDRHVLGRDTWKRGFREIWTDADGSIILDEGGLYAMIALYRKALKKAQRGVHIVMEKMQSLSQRIMELKDLLIPGTTIEMASLVPKIEWSKTKMVITFMSILELSRLGFTSIYQNDDCGPIHINTKKAIENDVVSRVQELNVQPMEIAADTHRLANDFEEDNVTVPMDAATDEDIAALEMQLEGSSMSTLVTDQESAMLVELGEKMEAIPEFNQPDEIIAEPLSESDIAAVEELVELEMLAPEADSDLPPEPGPEGDASV
jgi:segregation and condensation protein A